ncbi:hypothetical protein EGM51_03925 [Verrucomicrobia bacterium S94]|nr:hypothetical protein EGM51_03925 [Verrucomicrobia bacterium S94]
MLRFLRITGVIVFSILVGVSTYNIKEMRESGALYEPYNSARRSNITLLSSSMLVLCALVGFEINSIRRRREHYRLGDHRHREERPEKTERPTSSSIYAAPRQVDEWQMRQCKRSKTRKTRLKKKESAGGGLIFLRAISLALPSVYAVLLGWILIQRPEDELFRMLLPALAAMLLTVSVLAAIGIFRKKTWGLSLGYLLALCNLLIFPVGTAVGLFLLLALVASADAFAEAAAQRRRQARQRSSSRSGAATV